MAGESLGLPAVVEPAHLAVVRVEHVDKLLPCIGSEFAVTTLRSPSSRCRQGGELEGMQGDAEPGGPESLQFHEPDYPLAFK